MADLSLDLLERSGVAWAQELVTAHHYLHKPVDPRCIVEGYGVRLDSARIGALIFGRPQATRCYPWYGSVQDVETGRAEVTRWQVLNLARVYFSPIVQPGGTLHSPDFLPGFTDRQGAFRSTLASTVLKLVADRVVVEYLERRPPCFLEEPYQLRWLLSYCDTRVHRGTIYQAAGWELFRTNRGGIQTWRYPVRSLTRDEDARVRAAAAVHPRSQRHRAKRDQRDLLEVAPC